MPLLKVPFEGKYSVALHRDQADVGATPRSIFRDSKYIAQLQTEAEARMQDLAVVEFSWPGGLPYVGTGSTTYTIPADDDDAAVLTFIPWRGRIDSGRYRLLPASAEGQTACVTHSRWLLPAQNGICGMEAIDLHACRYATLLLL